MTLMSASVSISNFLADNLYLRSTVHGISLRFLSHIDPRKKITASSSCVVVTSSWIGCRPRVTQFKKMSDHVAVETYFICSWTIIFSVHSVAFFTLFKPSWKIWLTPCFSYELNVFLQLLYAPLLDAPFPWLTSSRSNYLAGMDDNVDWPATWDLTNSYWRAVLTAVSNIKSAVIFSFWQTSSSVMPITNQPRRKSQCYACHTTRARE